MTLQVKDGHQGAFFLGTGMIENTMYYFWYRRNEDGSVSGGKTARSEGVRIFDNIEVGGSPYMQTYKTSYVSKFWSKCIWLIGIDRSKEDDEDSWCPSFHIPAGSIKEGFVL